MNQRNQAMSDSEANPLTLVELVSVSNSGANALFNLLTRIQGTPAVTQSYTMTVGKYMTCLGNLDQDVRRDTRTYEIVRAPLENCAQQCTEIIATFSGYLKKSAGPDGFVQDVNEISHGGKNFVDKFNTFTHLIRILNLMRNHVELNTQSSTLEIIDGVKKEMKTVQQDLQDEVRRLEEQMSRRDAKTRNDAKSDIQRLQLGLKELSQFQQRILHSRPALIIERNHSDEESRAIYGTDSRDLQFDLNVSDNTAGARAIVGAGAHTPETLQALLGGSNRGDFYGIVQYMKVQQYANGFTQFFADARNALPPPTTVVHGLPEREDTSIRGLIAGPDSVIISERLRDEAHMKPRFQEESMMH